MRKEEILIVTSGNLKKELEEMSNLEKMEEGVVSSFTAECSAVLTIFCC